MRPLRCAQCKVEIAAKSDVFTVPGAEGTTGAYVNPQGFVHQTVTLRTASNLILVGSPEPEHSWFAGYAWTIAYCAGCHSHMGWRFTPTRRGGGGVASFFGVRRSELTDEPEGGGATGGVD